MLKRRLSITTAVCSWFLLSFLAITGTGGAVKHNASRGMGVLYSGHVRLFKLIPARTTSWTGEICRKKTAAMETPEFYSFRACTLGLLFINISFRVIEAQKVPAIFVFGDSYGDPGNNNYIGTTSTGNFPPYGKDFIDHIPTGRLSNGKIMPDFCAAGMGIKELLPAYLDPSVEDKDLLTGVSFASSGTGLHNVTAKILNVIPIWKQIEYFKECTRRLTGLVGKERTASIVKEGIHFIIIGTNDYIANYYLVPYRSLHFSVSEYTDLLLRTYKDYIQELYGLNARRIALINLPPLGCLPAERAERFYRSKGRCVENINEAASNFNAGLEATIEELKSSLSDLKIVSLDYHGLILDAITNPSKYGFEFTTKGCCGTGTYEIGFLCNKFTPFTCPDASKYVFFDTVHLTEKAYEIISEVFLRREIPQLL